jgi:hemolysin activation/secretion protein
MAGVLLAAQAVLAASLALAQNAPLLKGPGEQRPELPPLEPPEEERPGILPPIPLPVEPDLEGLSAGLRVFVREIRLTGNTALSDQELSALTAPYSNREISFADLEALRDQLTLAYIERGYVSSGALIPDQRIEDGVVEIRIVEGVLAEMEIETDGHLRESYLRKRLEPGAEGPVNVFELEERLQLLQQDRLIRSIRAELAPGELRGQSLLRVSVAEEGRTHASLELSNHQSPSIGSERGRFDLGYANPSGFGDSLSASFVVTQGLRQIEGSYQIPLNAHDTSLELHLSRSWSEVIEEPFDDLGIESRSATYGFTLRHPVHRSLRSELGLFATGEWRRSKSLLLGFGFPSEGISEEGVSKVSVLRFGGDWTYRGRRQVIALRSTLSWGIDLLGATSHGGSTPDGKFLAWLGQIQWVRRLGPLDSQLIVRGPSSWPSLPCWASSSSPSEGTRRSGATARTRWCATRAGSDPSSCAFPSSPAAPAHPSWSSRPSPTWGAPGTGSAHRPVGTHPSGWGSAPGSR